MKIKDTLKIMCPGTQLREGLENILRAKTGGLIVIGDNKEVMDTVDGGFNLNSDYSPSYVYELAKMDGAIVISEDLKKIVCANAQLIPDYSISTSETVVLQHRRYSVQTSIQTLTIFLLTTLGQQILYSALY